MAQGGAWPACDEVRSPKPWPWWCWESTVLAIGTLMGHSQLMGLLVWSQGTHRTIFIPSCTTFSPQITQNPETLV